MNPLALMKNPYLLCLILIPVTQLLVYRKLIEVINKVIYMSCAHFNRS